jgi:hypothetical protein
MRLAVVTATVAVAVAVVACASAQPDRLHTQGEANSDAPNVARLVCPTGRGDCDGDPSNGCETDLSADASNCRACGHACSGSEGAAAGLCVDGRCSH